MGISHRPSHHSQPAVLPASGASHHMITLRGLMRRAASPVPCPRVMSGGMFTRRSLAALARAVVARPAPIPSCSWTLGVRHAAAR